MPETALPNPNLRLDPALGLVVIEFRGRPGGLETIPSQRQLDAYRAGQRIAHGEAASPAPAGSPPPRPAEPAETGSGAATAHGRNEAG